MPETSGELLLEILSEEIPARMQVRAANDLKRLVTDGLKAADLDFEGADAFVTPRRLTLHVTGLPEKQPDVSEEKRGPRTDAPEKAINGFKGSLPDGAVIEERETEKGTFFFANIDKKGEATAAVLPGLLSKAFQDMPWPKSMRWASHDQRWVRPVHSVLALFDGTVIEAALGPVSAGGTTVGHPFMAPGAITVTDFADYVHKLREANVILDHQERCQIIGSAAMTLAEDAGLKLNEDHDLLHEVAGLVEWPTPYLGTIDDAFMDLPPEVLVTSMRSHQKYFSTLDADGKLANRFIMVANTETSDGGAQVIAGNERVLRARLADAKFFWDQDRKATLESRVDALKDRVFHAKLGSVLDKVERMEALAADLAAHVPGADANKARRGARLAKADLSSGMVGEFPDLQGTMGRYYATGDGEDAAVAQAVAEHYSPLGPNDACPSAPESACVALADKIDTLIGFWSIDEKPTGSKDPYALRRAALGVIRLIIENGLRLPLVPVFGDHGEDLLTFFADRLKVHLREQGVKHDHIDAVFALGGEDDLVRLLARVSALSDFLASEDGENLLTAYRRAANILKIEEKKDGRSYAEAADNALFSQDEEKTLAAGLDEVAPRIAEAVADERFADAMAALAGLRAPVDSFFDAVTVNADDADLRANRLKLLSGIRSALDGVADFSRIEG